MNALLHEPALRSLPPGRVKQEHDDWLQDREHERQLAAQAHWKKRNTLRASHDQPPNGYSHTPDRGTGISR